MGIGKIITLIGAILGLLSILLSLFIPEFLSWYRIEASGYGITGGVYLTGFGTFSTTGAISSINEIWIFELIGGIFVILGSILCIASIIKKSRVARIIGGIWILLGPIIFLIHIISNISDFSEIVEILGVGSDVNVFWGSVNESGVTTSWGLWIGFFLAVGGGTLGLVGKAKV